MALSNRNIITQGLSGLVGNSLVFRQRFGKTVVANAPSKPRKSPSKAMLKSRYKFKQAANMHSMRSKILL
ncbi:hypothetical protein [Pseudopedobacter beijingensis]|uniref:Uncharacterized protein n=1 Tax=Pseudopedobacter beijingensis TaxID=1207056 RepID=A0ABW4IDD8_9SPHI